MLFSEVYRHLRDSGKEWGRNVERVIGKYCTSTLQL